MTLVEPLILYPLPAVKPGPKCDRLNHKCCYIIDMSLRDTPFKNNAISFSICSGNARVIKPSLSNVSGYRADSPKSMKLSEPKVSAVVCSATVITLLYILSGQVYNPFLYVHKNNSNNNISV
jgi:hypothetical protein